MGTELDLTRIPASTLITATGNGTLDLNPLIAAGMTQLRIQALAGATGAGSGRRGAAGTVRCGGGPGANGAFVDVTVPISSILAMFGTGLVPYNVGPGTAGGAAVTADNMDGNPGAAPTVAVNGTWFGGSAGAEAFVIARPPFTAGGGGTAASGAAGIAMTGTAPNADVGGASPTGGPGVQGVFGGAGPGGGITSADVAGNGGTGQASAYGPGAMGVGGIVDGAGPGTGTNGPLIGPGASPGGGAASITTAAQAGANAPANSGKGGGGGGASLNGNNSGAGANGGSGFLRITGF